ncbi:MAG: hypothetical protein WC426_04600 [Sulfuriferula sp.]
MRYKLLFFILFFATNFSVNAGNLCFSTEKTVFTFATKSNKNLSICKSIDGSYLVYRFGTLNKIELQFPEKLDDTSWRQFEFSGMGRSGGKMNAGFGDYSIMFKNNNSEYTVFQEWSDEDGTYNIGVTVTNARGKTFSINGLKKSQEGSLVLLEGEGEKIPNKAE